jgi:hypothetical protein
MKLASSIQERYISLQEEGCIRRWGAFDVTGVLTDTGPRRPRLRSFKAFIIFYELRYAHSPDGFPLHFSLVTVGSS